jgi:hypothetical protein
MSYYSDNDWVFENKWIPGTTLPDFTIFGFHTGKLLEFMIEGSDEIFRGPYQGYGMFGYSCVENVMAWRPVDE